MLLQKCSRDIRSDGMPICFIDDISAPFAADLLEDEPYVAGLF